ncbi:MAG: flagellar motor switch protein FliG [Natronohydrobacter sp.]|nr:flagellar motor switch protein FliG [Natronohydrobacter sp.]
MLRPITGLVRDHGMTGADQQLMVSAARMGGPVAGTASPPRPDARARTDHLSGAQKAAIIVRLLLAEGLDAPVSALPHDLQSQLTQTLGSMRLVDRATMCAVVEEFVEMLEQVGLSFPDGLEGALSLLDGKLDARATQTLRALSRGQGENDPWVVVDQAEIADLLHLLTQESQLVGAVMLSKISTDKAAQILMKLPAEDAQALAISLSRTEDILPETVARIGATLAEQLGAKPSRAFSAPPSRRMGEILNVSPATLRDQLLRDVERADQGYAVGIRKALFTFQDIPARLATRDVPTVMREASTEDLMLVMAAKQPEDQPTIDFLLENMSKRVAETLREDAVAVPPPASDAYDAAALRLAATVRRLAEAGTITLAPVEP